MFGLFWIARHTQRTIRRSCRSSRSGGGLGCAGAVLLLAVLGGIVNSGGSSQPFPPYQAPAGIPAGPYGWVEDAQGHFHPALTPPGVGVPFIPPYALPAPPEHPAAAPLVALLLTALVIGGLALIGRRMTPRPMATALAATPPGAQATYRCCGKLIGQPHSPHCHNWQPPENPAHWSDRR